MQNVNSWRSVAAATGRADRPAAEAGVRRAYRTAGLAEPERIIWAASPRAAVETVEKLTDAGRSVREEVRTRPWADERRRMYDELGPAGWSALWSATGAQLWETTAALAERIRTGVVADLAPRPQDAAAVRLVLLDAVLGQHDAAWLAAFDGHGDRLAGLAEVARNAGWWWPYEHAVVITERPDVLHRDEAGRLDHGEGPALAYGDGFALHAWRGMPVPAAFLAELSSLTPERIRAEENAELRRVMLEYYGYDRYLSESGAEPVHRDETGILWRIALDGDEDVVMVEVVNSTPEPDGTYRTYWLRVPPTTRTAKDGVAWTFGLEGAAYAPVRQT
ncbi:hypothetical protein K7395_02945 [Streptomyces filamentosus]|uniref:DUF6745 domain-containing protein n=3 Tax=Streptomyces TaxID=1883 RepID=A0ABY4UNK0_STRFL|nr:MULTISPECIES: hypothetical protein [Streptomyces]EFE78967.1 conserved hypothetical protein [Streptomyces filamentosus NRRL 15998]EWS95824.1 hypothetical protein SSIG_06590 [Streptomyces filamentosus NRRL 11379]MYR82810.1 hypothetical protein [Streptomyces sp. SID5466]USC45750.1 hypothetical protein K7395_02945 [Streptomyces filamentosus]